MENGEYDVHKAKTEKVRFQDIAMLVLTLALQVTLLWKTQFYVCHKPC